jgi:hypothetical protein
MLEGFDFGAPAIASQLTGKLAALKEYNGLEIPKVRFFSSEMDHLRNRFLSVPVDAVLHPASLFAQQAATEQKDKAAMALAAQQAREQEERKRAEEVREIVTNASPPFPSKLSNIPLRVPLHFLGRDDALVFCLHQRIPKSA